MNKLKNAWLLLLLAAGVAACSDDDNEVQSSVSLSVNEVNVTLEGGESTFTVQTVDDWSITTDGQTWYTVSPTQGTGTTEVTLTIEASEEVAPRAAVITVQSGTATATLAITQTGSENPEDPTDQEISIRAAGGEREIVLPTNDGYEVVIPDDADWITLVEENEFSIVLEFDNNEGSDQYRSADVTVNNTDGTLLATLHLTQSWRNVEPGELLFQEIFLTSNLIEETGRTNSTSMEQYFILTNNTDETLEIGGIGFGESEIKTLNSTMLNLVWDPDMRDEVAAINSLYIIPKDEGKHTLAPYESVLIVNNAQNYRANNASSFDLSGADFEWYNESTVSSVIDTDNPDVPNLDIWISNTVSIFNLNVQMNSGYVLVSIPSDMTAADFVDSPDYLWTGNRSYNTANGNSFTFSFTYQVVPNDWVIDAVAVSTQEGFAYNPFSTALDAGFTYCAINSDDTSRYGKSMQRKSTDGILVDTNNSTNDFNHAVTASLAE